MTNSDKISAFQPQGPGFKSRRCRVLNICVTFFSAKADSAFHPYGVGKMSTSFYWGLTCDGLVSRPGGVMTLIRLTLVLQKPEISTGSNGPLGSEKDLAD